MHNAQVFVQIQTLNKPAHYQYRPWNVVPMVAGLHRFYCNCLFLFQLWNLYFNLTVEASLDLWWYKLTRTMAKMEDKDIWYKLYYITVSKDEFELQYYFQIFTNYWTSWDYFTIISQLVLISELDLATLT
jgi:hypothetical protein